LGRRLMRMVRVERFCCMVTMCSWLRMERLCSGGIR
jgi:hypothetical protein